MKRIMLMTKGFEELTEQNPQAGPISLEFVRRITGSEFDFGVGQPAERERVTDEGRTLVLPFNGPQIFAALNETRGVTLMLAEEY